MASTVDGALGSGAVLPRAGEVRAYGEQGATVRAVDVGVEDDGGGRGRYQHECVRGAIHRSELGVAEGGS